MNGFPPSLYSEGSEPDPRFSLANERTFLAWVRTALALLAAGVALEALEVPISPDFRLLAAGIFVALGLLAAVQGWTGWLRSERSMRNQQSLRDPIFGIWIVLGVFVGVGVIVVGYFL